MYKYRKIIAMVLALALAAAGVYYLREWSMSQVAYENELVAKTDIMPYTVISREMLGYKQVPKGSVDPTNIQDYQQVIGKVATMAILEGEPISPKKLGQALDVIKYGEVEIAIPVTPLTAVGLNVQPGDLVDIYWVGGAEGSGTAGVPTAITGTEQPPASYALTGAVPIARDARLISLKDQKGEARITGIIQGTEQTAQESLPSIAVVKIKESEAASLAEAVTTGTLVLTKKRTENIE